MKYNYLISGVFKTSKPPFVPFNLPVQLDYKIENGTQVKELEKDIYNRDNKNLLITNLILLGINE